MSQPAGIWAMKVGDKTAQDFSALNLQAAADYMGGTGGGRILFAGRITGHTNLTLYANTTLEGLGMNASEIVRDPAATGIAIREKTSGEGNGSSGATGIWLRDFKLTGNASGDGINLGNQGGAQLNINAGLENVFVGAFTAGYGMILNGNATYGRQIWANLNQYGFKFSGGGSNDWYKVTAEGNTSINIQMQDLADSFFGVHVEETANAGSTGSIEITGTENVIYSPTISLFFNRSQLIVTKSGGARNTIFGARVNPNGHTYSNLIYNEALAIGSGSTEYYIPMWADNGPNSSYFFNSSTGEIVKITGGKMPYVLATDGNNPATGSTITINPGLLVRVNGAGNVDTVTPVTNGLVCLVSGATPMTFKNGTGNLILNGDCVMTQNSVLTLLGDVTQGKWIEQGRNTL